MSWGWWVVAVVAAFNAGYALGSLLTNAKRDEEERERRG